MKENNENNKNSQDKIIEFIEKNFIETDDYTSSFDINDIKNNKNDSFACYVPLFSIFYYFFKKTDSSYLKFHSKQGMLMNTFILTAYIFEKLLVILFSVNTSYMHYTPPFITILAFVFDAFIIYLIGFGFYNVSKYKAKVLPFIGKFKIFK